MLCCDSVGSDISDSLLTVTYVAKVMTCPIQVQMKETPPSCLKDMMKQVQPCIHSQILQPDSIAYQPISLTLTTSSCFCSCNLSLSLTPLNFSLHAAPDLGRYQFSPEVNFTVPPPTIMPPDRPDDASPVGPVITSTHRKLTCLLIRQSRSSCSIA